METLKLGQMSDYGEESEVEEESTETPTLGTLEEKYIETSSLSSMVIKEVMEWYPRIGYPEPHLMDKIMRCEE